MLVVVTGASGFVGMRLVKRLLERGYRVRALSRHSALMRGVEVSRGDLLGELPMGLCDGADAIIHMAGELRDPERMRAVNVTGTGRLLDCGKDVPIWIQLSSVGVYGARASGTITEATEPAPLDVYERSKLAADELVHQRRANGQYVLLRPSIVYGPGMKSTALRSLAGAIRRHRFVYFGGPGAIAPYIHVDDVVGALIELLDGAAGLDSRLRSTGAYNLSNDAPLESFIESLAYAVGERPPTRRLPVFVGRVATLPARLTSRWPLTRERLNALTSRVRYPSERIKRELGWIPRVSHDRGLADYFASVRDA